MSVKEFASFVRNLLFSQPWLHVIMCLLYTSTSPNFGNRS